MKRNLLILSCCLIAAQITNAQINTFPYTTDFESEIQGATAAGTAYTMLTPGWVNDLNDDTDWIADTAGTASANTGPSVDHTTGSTAGYYMYVEASTNNVGYPDKESTLLTPYFDFTSLTNPKLSFWYHMFGADMGTLYVEAAQGNSSNWASLGSWSDNINLWQQDSVALCFFAGQDSVRLRFRGVTGASFEGDMAIDDIEVFEGTVVSSATVSAININGSDTFCAVTNYPVEIDFFNGGCQTSGDVVIQYWSDTSSITTDTITGLASGTTFTYVIPGGVDVSAGGTYALWCTTSDMTDTLFSGEAYFDATIDPVTNAATICIADSANLTATGDNVTWYNAAGSVVATGNSFTTPSLSSTTSYFAENQNYLPDNSLTTTFGATTSCTAGNMFDIVALKDLVIDSLFVYANSGAMQPVQVWYKWGSFAEAPDDSTQWTLFLTDSVDGTFTVTPLVDMGGFRVNAGDTLALYVISDLAYTSGYAEYENDELKFMAGNGNCVNWDNCCNPRTWNGIIYYKPISSCISNRVASVVTVENCDDAISENLDKIVRIFPNPAHHMVNIEFTSYSDIQSVELLSITGQSVFSTSQIKSNQLTLNVEQYPKGMYSLRVMKNDAIYFKKLIIE